MGTIDDILATVKGLPVAADGSITLAKTDFADIPVVQSFFASILGGQSYTLARAQRTSGNKEITVTGQADVLGYSNVTAAVTFATTAGPSDRNGTNGAAAPPIGEGVTASIVGTHISTTPKPLPIVTWIDVEDVTVSATVAEPYNAITYGFTASIVQRGDTTGTIPITISQRDAGLWTVAVAGTASQPLTIDKVVALIGGHSLDSFLPSELVRVLDGLALSDLEITFDPTAKVVTDVRLGLTVTNGWTAAPGVVLERGLHVALAVSNPSHDATREFVGIVTGTLKIDGVPVPVFVQVDVAGTGTSTWLVGLDPSSEGVTLPSLTGLFTLAGGQGFTDSLPPALAKVPAIQINPLLIGFTLSPAGLQRVSFGARTTSEWPLIQGFLTVENLAFAFELAGLAGAQKSVGGTLSAVFSITEDVWLYFQVVKDPASRLWTLSGGLPPGHSLNLTDLVAKLLSGYVTLPANAPALVLDKADVTVVPGTSMTFTAGSSTRWPVLSALALDSFKLSFAYTSGEPKPFTGTLATSMSIAGVPVSIWAGLDTSGTWSFTGSTDKGAKIEVGELIADLETTFHVPAIPTEALKGFTISDIDVAFSAGSTLGSPSAFRFGCLGMFVIAGTELDLLLNVELTSAGGPSGRYTGKFTGLLTIKKADQKTEQIRVELTGCRLTASWQSTPGHGLSLTDIVGAFGFTDVAIPSSVDLTLTTMTLEYDVAAAGLLIVANTETGGAITVAGDGTQCGVALQASTSISLSDLPLVGPELSKIQTVELSDFRVAASDRPLASAGTALNSLLDAHAASFPQNLVVPRFPSVAKGDASRLAFAAALRHGSGSVALQLPADAGAPATPTASPTVAAPTTPTLWREVDLGLGPLTLRRIGLRYARDPGTLWLALDTELALGPVTVDLEGLRVGVAIEDFRSVEFGLDGLAVTVDAPAVTGGGELLHDGDQYVGAVQLQFSGLTLAAVGFISTDAAGYSMLVLISAHFPPVRLGFGLALTGVGGLIAVNRTVDVPALRAGLQGGSLDAILFPVDVARNARKVVADLAQFFPPAAGQYLVGPTVELSWGEGGIVTATLGLFIEFPNPARVVLAGHLRMRLPKPSSAVVDVQLDVLGSLDLAARELAIDAVLRNSRIAAFALSGQAALRARWGEAPVFLLAIGGFNPRFPPPAGFPRLERVSLALADSANPRLRLSAYLALTANTLQFGATLDVHASAETAVGKFVVDGHLGFDALIDFAPFGFVVDVDGTVALTWKGSPLMAIALHVTLSGPQPWDVRGTATLQFLGTHSIAFAITLGQPRLEDVPPPIELETALREELEAVASWSAQPPASAGPLVTLAPGAVAVGESVLAHPLGTLTVKQRLAPLEVDITHVGSRRVSPAQRFTLTAAQELTPVTDAFAAAQFLDLSPDQKLLRPSFEPMVAGAQLGTPAPAVPDVSSWQRVPAPRGGEADVMIEVETVQLARDWAATTGKPRPLSADELVSQGQGAAGAVNGPANQGAATYERPGNPLTALLTPGFTVVDEHTLEPKGEATSFVAADELRGGQPGLEIIRGRPASMVGS